MTKIKVMMEARKHNGRGSVTVPMRRRANPLASRLIRYQTAMAMTRGSNRFCATISRVNTSVMITSAMANLTSFIEGFQMRGENPGRITQSLKFRQHGGGGLLHDYGRRSNAAAMGATT